MVAVADGPSWSSTRVTHLRHGGRGARGGGRGVSPKWPAKPPPDADGCCYCTMQWGQKIPCSYFVRSGGCLALIATFCCVIPGLAAVMYASKYGAVMTSLEWRHMNAKACQITSQSHGCSTACSGQYKRKHQRSPFLSVMGDRWIPLIAGQ